MTHLRRERIVTRERAISRVVVAADDADDDGTLNARFGAFRRVHDARDARGDARSRRDDVRSSCARTRARDALDARLARRARETVAVVPFARVARRARERRGGRDARRVDGRVRDARLGAADDAAPVSAGPREDLEFAFGADYSGDALSTQGEAVVKGVAAVEDKPSGMALDVDYLQELIAIQEDCPKDIGFFGTRNMGFMHQQLIEILAYALCLTGNHIYTSGATGTNAAVIRGALRAERPELLTVVLPQSLAKQPRESRELLEGVAQIVEAPENEDMPLVEASRICNDTIVSKVKQIIVFAFHDSRLLLETCRNAKTMRKLVTLFYLD